MRRQVGGAQRTPEIGRELCESPTVRKLGFTGSTAVGKLLMAQGPPDGRHRTSDDDHARARPGRSPHVRAPGRRSGGDRD